MKVSAELSGKNRVSKLAVVQVIYEQFTHEQTKVTKPSNRFCPKPE